MRRILGILGLVSIWFFAGCQNDGPVLGVRADTGAEAHASEAGDDGGDDGTPETNPEECAGFDMFERSKPIAAYTAPHEITSLVPFEVFNMSPDHTENELEEAMVAELGKQLEWQQGIDTTFCRLARGEYRLREYHAPKLDRWSSGTHIKRVSGWIEGSCCVSSPPTEDDAENAFCKRAFGPDAEGVFIWVSSVNSQDNIAGCPEFEMGCPTPAEGVMDEADAKSHTKAAAEARLKEMEELCTRFSSNKFQKLPEYSAGLSIYNSNYPSAIHDIFGRVVEEDWARSHQKYVGGVCCDVGAP
jgi:hypothetical protein